MFRRWQGWQTVYIRTACQLFLSLMLPRMGQPFPPERRNCSHTFRGVLKLRLPSALQRYNTLDFPGESRVPTGMLLAPIGNPEPKGLRPSGHPFMFVQRLSIPSGAVRFFLPEHETGTQI